jgi:hypothetical protein
MDISHRNFLPRKKTKGPELLRDGSGQTPYRYIALPAPEAVFFSGRWGTSNCNGDVIGDIMEIEMWDI